MLRHVFIFTVFLHLQNVVVLSAKQRVQLSDSYLPVAMQVIAHLTDQMAFEVKDDVPKTTTVKPLYVTSNYFASLPRGWGWSMRYGIMRDITTAFHKPGFYAPASPPKPSERIQIQKSNGFLLPVEQNSEYTIIEPHEKRTEEPLLAAHNDEVSPLLEPPPNPPHRLLPYDTDVKFPRSSDDEFDEENLQYLSPNVRDMIKMANDPDDDKLVDVWDGLRANHLEASSKGKLSTSNLRLLLLYDLLSRDAKTQRLSDYSLPSVLEVRSVVLKVRLELRTLGSEYITNTLQFYYGFSPDVMKNLVESSGGGARAQLKMALSKMVERHDCGHDYANNRAKEMVIELAKDESKLSSELRYLQPLVYKF